MKERWIVEAEHIAKVQAEVICTDIVDEADKLCVDRRWYFEKVVQYMRSESEVKNG